MSDIIDRVRGPLPDADTALRGQKPSLTPPHRPYKGVFIMSLVGWGSSAGVLLAIAVAAAQGTAVRPGQVNYIEGQVALEGKALTPGALEGVEVATGQTLSTEKGKAEVLLTPGVFLRLGEQAAVKMTSQSVSDTRVELVKGDAILEVVQPGVGRVLVVDGQARADVRKAGVYEFHANGAVAVMAGKARVEANDRRGRAQLESPIAAARSRCPLCVEPAALARGCPCQREHRAGAGGDGPGELEGRWLVLESILRQLGFSSGRLCPFRPLWGGVFLGALLLGVRRGGHSLSRLLYGRPVGRGPEQ